MGGFADLSTLGRRTGLSLDRDTLIAVGEETGNIDEVLDKIAQSYHSEVDAALKVVASIIELLMIVGVGVIVGKFVNAMYLPMFRIFKVIQ